MDHTHKEKESPAPVVLRGEPLVPGMAFGYVHFEEPFGPSEAQKNIETTQIAAEKKRLRQAIEHVRDHLDVHVSEAHAAGEQDAGRILEAHQVILEDAQFIADIEERIESKCYPASRAVQEAFSNSAAQLAAARDPYLAARADDLRDICQNIRKVLVHGPQALDSVVVLHKRPIFVSTTLRPSSVLRAVRAQALGYATCCQAATSHGAILLRSSGMPAVAHLPRPHTPPAHGTPVLVDGNRGQIVFWPTAEQIAEAEAYEKQKAQKTAVTTVAPTPARLPNGEAVTLWANLDNPMQIPHVLAQGLNGVGLFRTEFLVLGRRAIPDEETQTQIYTDVVRALEGRRLTIRTFDLGGDKEAPTLEECSGQNPALGVRGLRRHLQYRNAELITQLKAIMRAAHHGPVSILLPMVTNARDIHAFKELFEAARDALAATSHSFDAEIPLGAMIEVPSSALNVEKIMRRVDFISIGTNDLMQYVTAADRDNTVVLGYHDLKCSGTEKLIEWIMETAGRLGRVEDVSLCGDLASRPSGAQDLVQLGLRSLSIFPAAAPAIRRALESQQPQTQQPQTQKPPETQALENQQPQNQKPPETQK